MRWVKGMIKDSGGHREVARGQWTPPAALSNTTRRHAPPPPPPGRPAYAQPLSPWRQVPLSRAFVTDSNRPQPLGQPPPTACLTASGATSEAPSLPMHLCPPPPPLPSTSDIDQ